MGPSSYIAGTDFEVLATSERGDGRHQVLKGELLDDVGTKSPFVLKTYGLKRNRLRTLFWWFGHRVLVGKSSVTIRGRFHTERETLRLWAGHDLDVPRVLDVVLPKSIPSPHVAMEWIEGKTLGDAISDPGVELHSKINWTKRLAHDLGHRHRLALETKDPRLLHEHPRLDHLLVQGDRLVTHDLEIVFTRRHNIEGLIGHELAGFLKSLAARGGEHRDALLDVFIDSYPEKNRLCALDATLSKGSLFGLGWLYSMDAKRRLSDPKSKYAIARDVSLRASKRVAINPSS